MTAGPLFADDTLSGQAALAGDASAPVPEEVEPRSPRELTPEVRRKIGLPDRALAPYRWPHAVIAVFVFGVPLAIAGHPGLSALLALVALVVMPVWRQVEHRASKAGEALYRDGEEALARVIWVEPAGHGKRDHLIRVEYMVGDARVEAKIVGAPLARKGLGPGEDVVVIFDPQQPTRCLLVERVSREGRARARRPPPPRADDDHDHDHAHGHGKGACDGKGGCGGGGKCGGGGGGCGGGGCGGGGCGGGGCGH